ncbi:Rpr2-domain-containing protein [Aureobasidium pullulans]|uniref:Rpr2-domain-containing protein n=1 Tax=Aureobasidium pullulans TaxID=5580 RepID=A0A4S8VAE5_AURPU|nr:Rpr2-domain-containing protein [Aureobasidium pullulans]THX97256.1 Rpr2-domain-containing protein [Aureobasidium pullulans]
MAKASADKAKSVPNKHLHARIAFLHQAATHLALHRPPIARSESTDANVRLQQHGLPLLLAAQLKAVSLKAQIRLSHDVKRSICKVCTTPLMPDTTSETRIENMSRASKKPHADLLVIRCRNCQTEKRFPIGATRQKKKAERKAAAATAAVSIKGQEIEVEMKDA